MSLASASRILCGLAAVVIAGCSGVSVEEPEVRPTEQTERIRQQYGTITGEQGLVVFSSRQREGQDGGGPSIGVNVYLWRAALETIDFMPLVQADPFGGVIITDWFSPPETPGERFKLTVYILDRVLRADAVKVAVFRQINDEGGWTDATVEPTTATGIEDSILTRARELRIAALGPAQG
jgi:Domain of unknown function (DUF3576)